MQNLVSNLAPRTYHTQDGLSFFGDAVRVVVADAAVDFRESTCEILKAFFDVEISGCAKNGFEALQLAIAFAPDLLIMSTDLPGLDGLATARLVTDACPATQILMVSSDEPRQQGAATRFAGVYSVISKAELAVIFSNLCGPAS